MSKVPSPAADYRLVGSLDAIVLLRRDHASLLESGVVRLEPDHAVTVGRARSESRGIERVG